MDLSKEQLEVLTARVYRPVFVKICADRGWPVETEESLQSALQSAVAIKFSAQQNGDDLHKQAGLVLFQHLGLDRVPPQAQPIDDLVTTLAEDESVNQVLLSQ